MSATPTKKSSTWNIVVAIVFIVIGVYGIVLARVDAGRHIVRHGAYRAGYAPIYPWQAYGFSIGMLVLAAILLYPIIQRSILGGDFTIGESAARQSHDTASPSESTPKA